MPIACSSGLPYSSNLYHIETLFSSIGNSIILTEGSHELFARIRNSRTGNLIRTCYLKYEIIVIRCKPFVPLSENVQAICSLGDLWGSECRFRCKNNMELYGRESVTCEDSGVWSGAQPECFIEKSKCSIDF